MSRATFSHHCIFILLGPTLCWLAGCSDTKESNTAEKTVTFVTLTYAPVSTFQQSCHICHTPQTQWFDPMVAQRNRSLLLPKVKEMMEDQAFLKPTKNDVNAMAAYCRALSGDEPFLCVLSMAPEGAVSAVQIQGEATPNATVRIGPQETQADGNGAWEFTSCTLPDDRVIEAVLNGKTTRLSLHTAQWSHDR